jgi:hypothetical protein
MAYNAENTIRIKEEYAGIHHIHEQLIIKLLVLQPKLKSEKSREYLTQGVCRRLNIVARCIHNIFKIFPIEKKDVLSRDDLTDLCINLHAFFVNISGIIDNLGWVFVYENDLFGSPKEGKIDKNGVGLFNKKTQAHLGPDLNTYLKSDRMKTWHTEYSKNYRDALAHRIPLYVPPSALNKEEKDEYMLLEKKLWDYSSSETISQHDQIREKQSQLGRACLFFTHSFSEESKFVFLHAQVIADFMTIEEIINEFCDNFARRK